MTPTIIHGVVLRRLTTQDLPAIAGWFEDPATSRFLGGPEWPAGMLAHGQRTVGEEFRGARQTAADHFLALTDGVPVGYVDCGTFDRCAIYGGEGQDGPIVLETIEAITGAIAFTIDPARRRQGLGTQMIGALIDHPDLSTVELFEAGVDPENHAARRTLETAGFQLRSPEPDCEEMLYYERWALDPSVRVGRGSSRSPDQDEPQDLDRQPKLDDLSLRTVRVGARQPGYLAVAEGELDDVAAIATILREHSEPRAAG